MAPEGVTDGPISENALSSRKSELLRNYSPFEHAFHNSIKQFIEDLSDENREYKDAIKALSEINEYFVNKYGMLFFDTMYRNQEDVTFIPLDRHCSLFPMEYYMKSDETIEIYISKLNEILLQVYNYRNEASMNFSNNISNLKDAFSK